MLNLKVIAVAAALTLSAGGVALADSSATDALSSASAISIQTVGALDATNLKAGTGGAEFVDLNSVKALIQNNPRLLGQLESYGASVDDVVGIRGTDSTDVTIFVQG